MINYHSIYIVSAPVWDPSLKAFTAGFAVAAFRNKEDASEYLKKLYIKIADLYEDHGIHQDQIVYRLRQIVYDKDAQELFIKRVAYYEDKFYG